MPSPVESIYSDDLTIGDPADPNLAWQDGEAVILQPIRPDWDED